jgi:hypothetical protein
MDAAERVTQVAGDRQVPRRRFRLRLVVLVALLFQIPATKALALSLVRGPYLQQATSTSMIVRWRTDTASESTLRYGPASNDLSTTISLPGPATEHEIPIQGLQATTKYYYSIGTSAQVLAGADADHFFVTSPFAGSPQSTRIWVLGDSGVNTVEARQVRDEYLNFAAGDLADVWLMLGDNAYLSGTDAEYTANLFDLYPTILRNTVLWPAPGNHEFSGVPGSSDPLTETGPYYDAFSLPTQAEAGGVASGTETHYSFDYANIHFVSLNFYVVPISPGSAVYDWLEADLQSTNQDWIIVYMHHPPYSRGARDSDTDFLMTKVRTIYNPVFEANGVDLVLAGHSHSYQRSMLIDGHYGIASTLTPANVLDAGDGDPLGDGAYTKPAIGDPARKGTVYVVNGVGANAFEGGGTLDHPVMVTGFELEGSTLIDIDGGVLDAYFISRDGDILDRFRIKKIVPVPASGPIGLFVLGSLITTFAWFVLRSGRRDRRAS